MNEPTTNAVDSELDYKESLRTGLGQILADAIMNSNLTQVQMQHVMGVPQSNISRLKKKDYSHCAEGRLMALLLRLGFDVEIKVRPGKVAQEPGRLTITEVNS